MTTRIENVALVSPKGRARIEEFMDTLMALEVGQSFLWPVVDTNERLIIRAVGYVLKKQFTAQRKGEAYRVGRLS